VTRFDLERPQAVSAAERYIAHPAPLFSRLPIPYRVVPLRIRTALLGTLARRGVDEAAFPRWPIERGIDAAIDPPRYRGKRAAFILTHDIDSAAELGFLDEALALDREVGIESSVGFVPYLSWPLEKLVKKLQGEGREVYWHDIRHDGRLPYMPINRIRQVFDEILAASPWANDVRTFRAGQLLVSANLMTVVAERFAIDMSLPDTERHGPYGASAGCGTVYPFRLGGLLEVPVTMPQDVFLRHVYRYPPAKIAEIWSRKIDYIVDRGGVISLNIHPIWIGRRDPDLTSVVRELLERVVANADILPVTPLGLQAVLRESEVEASQA
jgi:hypothetical protein